MLFTVLRFRLDNHETSLPNLLNNDSARAVSRDRPAKLRSTYDLTAQPIAGSLASRPALHASSGFRGQAPTDFEESFSFTLPRIK